MDFQDQLCPKWPLASPISFKFVKCSNGQRGSNTLSRVILQIWQLESLFLQGPTGSQGIFMSNSQNIQSYSQALSQNLAPMPRRSSIAARWVRRRRNHLVQNWRRVWVVCLWMAVMVGLFTWKFLQYKNKRADFEVMGYCVCVAKGAAETLKLNMALILLPVCRNTITWLRSSTKLGSFIPFDDNLNFHKVS